MTKGRVLMAMSGGIDSSIAAILLHKAGYEIVGITMKTWDYALSGFNKKETGCCNLDTINDARRVAVKLGFPHYTLDLQEAFKEHIISNFISEYMAGFTPNPCVLCNTKIKWEALLKKADALDCKYIATGHYAQIRYENNRYVLSKGLDSTKDQSYVLWGLTQENLSRTIFPLGGYTKDKIRDMAVDEGFKYLAQKKESYDICFIPDDDYRRFLRQQLPDIDNKIGQGNFINAQGQILGQHRGYPFYTIGQRKGLDIALGYPVYVKAIDATTNTIVLGKKEELLQTRMCVSELNFIKYNQLPKEGIRCLVKVRYKDAGIMAIIIPLTDTHVEITFDEPVSAITPGQSAVFIEDNDIIGGGIIKKVLE